MAFLVVVLFASHDHQFVSTVAHWIVEFTPDGIIDLMQDFDEYLAMKKATLSGENDYPAMKAAM